MPETCPSCGSALPARATPDGEPSAEKLRRAVAEWICLRGASPSSADADHSSLLLRLLSGAPALPFKPPRRFSYPDYALAEGQPVVIMEFYVRDHKVAVVDQSAWNIVERAQDNHYLLEWPEEPGSRYLLQPNRKGQPAGVLVLAEYNGFVLQRRAALAAAGGNMTKCRRCRYCGQPMKPKWMKKRPGEFDHAQECPYSRKRKTAAPEDPSPTPG